MKNTKTKKSIYPQICQALNCMFLRSRTCRELGCVLTEDHIDAIKRSIDEAQTHILQVIHERLKTEE